MDTGTNAGRRLQIGDVEIDDTSDCFVIAEIGHNHQGSLEQARAMFASAKECGANAVKLQKRDNRSLYTEEYFNRPYEHENSFGATYGEHREALEFGRDEYRELQEYADELGLVFFSTAFDQPSVDFLAELDIPAFKIASADIRNLPLLRYAAEVGKPMVISTGAATLDDVRAAYETVKPINPDFAILQCSAGYPPAWDELDLGVISTYRELFEDTVIGFSSHDSGIAMAVAAYALGARVVEKHFTLNRAMKGTDHAFSLEPQGLEKMCRDLRRLRVALGDGSKQRYESEDAPATKMGKKLVAARDLPEGHVLEAGDLAAKSPGDGVPPSRQERFIGATLQRAVRSDEALSFELIGEPDEAGSEAATSGAGRA